MAAAKQRFWTALEQFLKENSYEVSPSTAVRKLDGAFLTAAKFEHVQIRRHGNWIVRASVPEPAGSMWDCTVPGGFFLECEGKTIDGAANCLTKHCQTVCTFGIEPENLVSMVIEKGLSGADRIVPVGHALDFSLVWDGINLIESMSRRIHVLIREHI